MNGYIKDNIYIFDELLKSSDTFRFRHFMNTDVFIYFSHHSITVPTYSYIKIGH